MGAASLGESLLEGLPTMSTSFQQMPALPSGTSETFGRQTMVHSHSSKDHTSLQHPSIKQASKDCTSHRSLQHYTLSKPSAANKNGAELAAPVLKRKPESFVKDKENRVPTGAIHTTQPRQSRLPLPTFLISNEGRRSHCLD